MSLDAMKQALAALEEINQLSIGENAICLPAEIDTTMDALRTAIEQAQEPVAFDHGIGIDRFKVVRGAFWWHVLIGDSPTEHGKFRSRVSAETMAADLLREFRNGAFVQHAAPRNWQGLTDDEIALICGECAASTHQTDDLSYARAIEAKLREKNT
jgi:hypothetical protein